MASMRARTVEAQNLYTVAEFEQLPEFDERYELIDGRLMEKNVAGGEHSFIARRVLRVYDRFDPAEKVGFMLQESSVTLGPKNAPIPDISFWRAERGVKIVKGAMPLPDLAIEIHSPGDLKSPSAELRAMVKVEKLLAAGVGVVWVIYPNRQEITVYQAAKGYQAGPVETLGLEDELDGEDVIPGFKLSVRELFE